MLDVLWMLMMLPEMPDPKPGTPRGLPGSLPAASLPAPARPARTRPMRRQSRRGTTATRRSRTG